MHTHGKQKYGLNSSMLRPDVMCTHASYFTFFATSLLAQGEEYDRNERGVDTSLIGPDGEEVNLIGEDCTAEYACDKTVSFLEFSLCLSRACLGKTIVYIYKWLKNAVFGTIRTAPIKLPTYAHTKRTHEAPPSAPFPCCFVCLSLCTRTRTPFSIQY